MRSSLGGERSTICFTVEGKIADTWPRRRHKVLGLGRWFLGPKPKRGSTNLNWNDMVNDQCGTGLVHLCAQIGVVAGYKLCCDTWGRPRLLYPHETVGAYKYVYSTNETASQVARVVAVDKVWREQRVPAQAQDAGHGSAVQRSFVPGGAYCYRGSRKLVLSSAWIIETREEVYVVNVIRSKSTSRTAGNHRILLSCSHKAKRYSMHIIHAIVVQYASLWGEIRGRVSNCTSVNIIIVCAITRVFPCCKIPNAARSINFRSKLFVCCTCYSCLLW